MKMDFKINKPNPYPPKQEQINNKRKGRTIISCAVEVWCRFLFSIWSQLCYIYAVIELCSSAHIEYGIIHLFKSY